MSTKPKHPGIPPRHPLSAIFPAHDDAAQGLHQLADDIKEYGLREPIVIYEEQTLDGWRRGLACERSGVEPRFRAFKGTALEAAAFVWSANFHRRHLGEGERSLVAARYKSYLKANPTGEPLNGIPGKFDISRSKLDAATKVVTKAEPEVVAAVEAGTISVSDAAKIADEKPTVQREAVKSVEEKQAATAAKAAKKIKAVQTDAVDAFGTEIPKRCRDAYLDPWIQSAIDFLGITEASIRKEKLLDGIDKRKRHYPFINVKDVLDGLGFAMTYLDQVLEHLKENRPAGVCPACNGSGCADCKLGGLVPRGIYQELKDKVKS